MMKNFYDEALVWTFKDFPEMNYTTFLTMEGELGGGLYPVSDEYPRGKVLIYIHTFDIDMSKAKILASGGTVVTDNYDIPGVGTMISFQDPSSNHLALLQPV